MRHVPSDVSARHARLDRCGDGHAAAVLGVVAVALGAVQRRVVAKAEWTGGEANPRFVVTSLAREEHEARHLYEKLDCARGEMENRIKECQLDLYADRTSAHTMRANQLRLWFASMAYVLICALRRIGLAQTQFARASCGTIRLKLLKIAPGAHQCAPHQARHAVGLSLSGRVPCRSRRARRRDGLTNQTAQAKIIPQPPWDHCPHEDLQKLKLSLQPTTKTLFIG